MKAGNQTIVVHWDGHTSKTPITLSGEDLQTFDSQFIKKQWNGPSRFNGVQFHFHAGSEHTIDGKRQDLEMHTVFLPVTDAGKGGFNYAAMGIFFSVNDYTVRDLTPSQIQIIDNFFDSLKWN